MKTHLAAIAACLALQTAGVPVQAQAQTASVQTEAELAAEQAAIEAVLKGYEQALNASDVAAVMALYTDDSVLLPQATPTVVGREAVEQFYVGTFAAVKIDLEFTVAEVQVVSADWAFLRTNAAGSMKVLATGMDAPAQTQELFVLRKNGGQWKLARYSFSATQPGAM